MTVLQLRISIDQSDLSFAWLVGARDTSHKTLFPPQVEGGVWGRDSRRTYRPMPRAYHRAAEFQVKPVRHRQGLIEPP